MQARREVPEGQKLPEGRGGRVAGRSCRNGRDCRGGEALESDKEWREQALRQSGIGNGQFCRTGRRGGQAGQWCGRIGGEQVEGSDAGDRGSGRGAGGNVEGIRSDMGSGGVVEGEGGHEDKGDGRMDGKERKRGRDRGDRVGNTGSETRNGLETRRKLGRGFEAVGNMIDAEEGLKMLGT